MASRPDLRVLCVSLALLGAGAGPAAPARAQAPAVEEAPFSERVDVEVVSVDVIVTDRKQGRVVDLGKDDFEVLVDGHAVAIDYFAAPRLAPASRALAGESISELTVAPRAAPAPIAPTNLILYVDQTALENRARHETVTELREFLAARPAGVDRVMVAAFEQDLRVLLQPTTDPVRIAQALDELESRPSLAKLTSSERAQLYQDIRAFGRNAMRVSGASAGLRAARILEGEVIRLENEITLWAEQVLDREARSVESLERLVRALAASEGRKAVVLATAGIQGYPARGLFAALDQQRGVVTSSDSQRSPTLEQRGQETLRQFEQMVHAAQNARVAFYTVSPLVQTPAENSAEFGSAGPQADRPLPRDLGMMEASSSIARLAGATGGATLNIASDLDRRLEMVTADIDATYSLGFSTGAEAGDKAHRIDVRVRRPGVAVRHRESFQRSSAPERAESALSAAVTFGQAENPLEITLRLGAGKSDGKKKGGQIVPLAVGMPLRFLSLVPAGDVRSGKVSVRVAIQDARGRLLESGAAEVPIVVPENQMEKAMVSSWYHRAEMRLAPGPQRVAVVVLDEVSGVQSTAFADIDIPATK
ncbi:MAG: VWA domain-containing protein [Thermoanaerobaculia bacterium]